MWIMSLSCMGRASQLFICHNWERNWLDIEVGVLPVRLTKSVKQVGLWCEIHWTPFEIKIRHPKEGRFNSHCVNPRFPLSAPWRRPTLTSVFWVQHSKGEYEAFRTGGVLREDTRVETANDIPFFITHSNGVAREKGVKYTHLFMINAASFSSKWKLERQPLVHSSHS